MARTTHSTARAMQRGQWVIPMGLALYQFSPWQAEALS
jgi:hypothetical protein